MGKKGKAALGMKKEKIYFFHHGLPVSPANPRVDLVEALRPLEEDFDQFPPTEVTVWKSNITLG